MAGVPRGFHRVNFNCPTALHQRLTQELTKSGLPMAEALRAALEAYLSTGMPAKALEVRNDALRIDSLPAPSKDQAQALVPLQGQADETPDDELAGIDPRLL